jgi:hypothetical protein
MAKPKPRKHLHDPEIHRHKCSDLTLDVSKFGKLNWIQPTGDFGAGFSNGPESASGKYRLAWRAKKGTVAVLLCHGKCVFMGVRALVDPASISSDAMCRIPAWVFSGRAVCCRTSFCVGVRLPGCSRIFWCLIRTPDVPLQFRHLHCALSAIGAEHPSNIMTVTGTHGIFSFAEIPYKGLHDTGVCELLETFNRR